MHWQLERHQWLDPRLTPKPSFRYLPGCGLRCCLWRYFVVRLVSTVALTRHHPHYLPQPSVPYTSRTRNWRRMDRCTATWTAEVADRHSCSPSATGLISLTPKPRPQPEPRLKPMLASIPLTPSTMPECAWTHRKHSHCAEGCARIHPWRHHLVGIARFGAQLWGPWAIDLRLAFR